MALLGSEIVRFGISGFSQIPYGSFSGKETAIPVFAGTIPDIELYEGSAETNYDYTSYFTNASTYSISPAVESGWSFSAGILTINPTIAGTYGPYTVTGTNFGINADSNVFNVTVYKWMPATDDTSVWSATSDDTTTWTDTTDDTSVWSATSDDTTTWTDTTDDTTTWN